MFLGIQLGGIYSVFGSTSRDSGHVVEGPDAVVPSCNFWLDVQLWWTTRTTKHMLEI